MIFIHPTPSKQQGEEIPDGRIGGRNKSTNDKGGEQERKFPFAFFFTEASCSVGDHRDSVRQAGSIISFQSILKGQDCI